MQNPENPERPDQAELSEFLIPEKPEDGAERKWQQSETNGSATEGHSISDADGRPLFERRRNTTQNEGEERVLSSHQSRFEYDPAGRLMEEQSQRLPDHPKGVSDAVEQYSYASETDQQPSVIEGRVNAGPDAGHEWRKTIKRREVPTLGYVTTETTTILEQGDNPAKPLADSVSVTTKFTTLDGKWFGEQTVNEKGEASQIGDVPPKGSGWYQS